MALANAVYGHADSEMELERPGADAVMPIFYMEKQINRAKSDAAQRAIYDEYEAVRYVIPGDNTTEHKERVTDDIKRRFRTRYEAFKAGVEQIDGMPLDTWYPLLNHPGLVEEMRAIKVRSVEDLANLSDDYATRAAWGLEWRKKAKIEIERRKTSEAQIEANAELTDQLATERAAREALEKRLAALEGGAGALGVARGPGRPPNPRPAA